MTFNKWIYEQTGKTWAELQAEGTTQEQRYLLYEDYEEYCNINNIEPYWNFAGSEAAARK